MFDSEQEGEDELPTAKQPRRALTGDQREDARRLKAAFNEFKAANRGKGITQEWLSKQIGWHGQSAVEQYLNARIPLNLEALLSFCRVLNILPQRISPRLAANLELTQEFGGGQAAQSIGPFEPLHAVHEPSARYGAAVPSTFSVSVLPPLVDQPGARPFYVCLDELGSGVVERASSLAYLRMSGKDAAVVGSIHPNDTLLVDTQDVQVSAEAVYAVRWKSELLVRRLKSINGEQLRLLADNLPPSEVEQISSPDFAILGRVVSRMGTANLLA